MKRKSICLFLWLLLIGLSYGGGYLCMTWPLSQIKIISEPEIIPVTAGKENFILPGTKLVTQTVNLKTGETTSESGPMPSIYLGLERQELISVLQDYMRDMPIKERELGLIGYDLLSYSQKEVILKKYYYPDDDFHKYYIIYKQGRLTVYYSDRKTVLEYPDISFKDLPFDIQCRLLTGFEVKDEDELYSFLQNYSS